MKRRDGLALAGIGLFYLLLEGVGITCPIQFLTGVSCAGCGMSRAWRAALGLDFAAAFRYHPLWMLPPPGAVWLLLQKKLPKKVFDAGLWVGCGLFLAVWLVRLVLPGDVVAFAPWEGAVWRLVRHVIP